MPHLRTRKVKEPIGDQAPTMGALCKALGVHRNTMREWRRRGGLGAKKPYSIVTTYLWAKRNGCNPHLPRDPELQRLIRLSDPPAPAARAAPALTDGTTTGSTGLPGVCAYDHLVEDRPNDYKGALEREKVRGEEIENERRRIEVDKARGELVTRAEAEKAAAAVRDAFVAGGEQLGARAIEKLGALDLSASTKATIAEAVDAAWQDVVDSVVR